MAEKISIRDKRDSKWFWVNNEIYDMKLSCEALAMYCAIARYANNNTEKSYFSGKRFKAHHKIGHAKLEAARAELLANNLIKETGGKNVSGALYYELLEVSQGETGGCSEAGQGGVSPQNTNHTKKTIQENHTDSFGMTPRTYEEKKPKKPIQLRHSDKELAKPIYEILDKSSFKVEHSKTLTQKIVKAIKKHGLETMKTATAGRCAYQAASGKELYIHYFMCDDESIEWHSKGPEKTEAPLSTLPVYGAGEVWYG